jgi:hypothetical protein
VVSDGGGIGDKVRETAVIPWVSLAVSFSSRNGGDVRLERRGRG